MVSKNIRYPEEARQNNIEGTVVTSFVVEPNGRISGIRILKDIGGGCGTEAVRVIQALDEAGLRWIPARREGMPVRMRQALPLRFKLQEALPYYIHPGGDSIYVVVDSLPMFEGGEEGLLRFIINKLKYPGAYRDSCKTGVIEMALIIHPNGEVEIDNQLDFSALGMDFQWEAVRLVNQTKGMWTAARYQGKPVATTVPVRTMFKSDIPACQETNTRFDQAMILSNEAANLADQNEQERALVKWNQAVYLQPENAEILYYRGSTHLSLNQREAACEDFNRVKVLLGTTWFEPLRRLVCGW
ncbi:MAG: TonB family protein [Saprospirales bacterium]|nr:TonB family protein [Saprospirales bacterium]